MNPLKHIDPIGSVLVPIVTSMSANGFMFGWAKPVPYNPYNLRDQEWGEAKVALAGPLTNLGIAFIFAMLLRFGGMFLTDAMLSLTHLIVLINIILAVFNLVPIPPLDGSKVLLSSLPLRYRYIGEYLERYSLALIFIFAVFLWGYFFPIVTFLYQLMVGVPL
jgi:Zn-dependent protease